ncbi:MAG TPA: hypothetical protein DHN33_01380 [Eubacteriaceae bacterium]|nr:hypothetical protein [Eubacteriaceae bacterium]
MKNNPTPDRLYQCAKELFYEKGYKKTSLTDITCAAQVNKALIKYYYDNKANLAATVINELNEKVRSTLLEKLDQLGIYPPDSILVGIEAYLFASFRKKNPNYRRFMRELCEDNVLLLSSERLPMLYGFYRSVCTEFGITLTDVEIETYHYSLAFTLNGLILMHDLGHIHCDHDQLANQELEIFFRVLGIESDARKKILQKSKEIVDRIELSIEEHFEVE